MKWFWLAHNLLWVFLGAMNLANLFLPYPHTPQWFSLTIVGLALLRINHLELYGSKED